VTVVFPFCFAFTPPLGLVSSLSLNLACLACEGEGVAEEREVGLAGAGGFSGEMRLAHVGGAPDNKDDDDDDDGDDEDDDDDDDDDEDDDDDNDDDDDDDDEDDDDDNRLDLALSSVNSRPTFRNA
jgi:hypothetical protein